MPPAIIGGAIAGVGAIGSAVIANKGASKAAQATQQAADTSAQVIRENYDKSAQALAPWQQSGLAANSAINALLGLGGQPVAQQPMPISPNPANDAMGWNDLAYGDRMGGWGARMGGQQRPMGLANRPVQMPGTPAAPARTAQQAYEDAFANYRNSTGYQFRLNQGLDAVNSGYAGAGSIKSGAAMKAINDYGQGMASQEFGNYLASLGNQQQVGFGAASAQAGVSQNLGNSLANIYTNQGNNMANAALLKAQNTGNAINSIAGLAGGLFGKGG